MSEHPSADEIIQEANKRVDSYGWMAKRIATLTAELAEAQRMFKVSREGEPNWFITVDYFHEVYEEKTARRAEVVRLREIQQQQHSALVELVAKARPAADNLPTGVVIPMIHTDLLSAIGRARQAIKRKSAKEGSADES